MHNQFCAQLLLQAPPRRLAGDFRFQQVIKTTTVIRTKISAINIKLIFQFHHVLLINPHFIVHRIQRQKIKICHEISRNFAFNI